jgi:hypothetical protein
MKPWCAMPTATRPIPDQESSQVRSAQRARSFEGLGSPANPSAAMSRRQRWSAMVSGSIDHHLLAAVERRDGLTPVGSAHGSAQSAEQSAQRPVSPYAPVAQVDRAAVS